MQNSVLPKCQKRGPTFSRTVTKIQRSPVRVSGRWCWSGMAASSNWSGFTPWSSLQFLLHWVFCTGTFSSTMKSSERFLNLFASIVQGEHFLRHSEIECTNVTYIINAFQIYSQSLVKSDIRLHIFLIKIFRFTR